MLKRREKPMTDGQFWHNEHNIVRDEYEKAARAHDALVGGYNDLLAALTAKDEEIARLNDAIEDEIGQRDNREEWADRLAYAIAPVNVIGEHSNLNNPWLNALDELDGQRQSVVRERDSARRQVAELTAALRYADEGLRAVIRVPWEGKEAAAWWDRYKSPGCNEVRRALLARHETP